MAKKAFKAGDIVRITKSVETIERTQAAPHDFAEHVAGKELKIIAGYKDGSYDLEGTPLMLDASVMEYVRHEPKVRKHEHKWEEVSGYRTCMVCGKSRKLPEKEMVMKLEPGFDTEGNLAEMSLVRE